MNWTVPLGLAGNTPSIGALAVDLNNDQAVDLVVSGLNVPAIFMNPRDAAFQSISPWAAEMPKLPAGIAALDFDRTDGRIWLSLTGPNPE